MSIDWGTTPNLTLGWFWKRIPLMRPWNYCISDRLRKYFRNTYTLILITIRRSCFTKSSNNTQSLGDNFPWRRHCNRSCRRSNHKTTQNPTWSSTRAATAERTLLCRAHSPPLPPKCIAWHSVQYRTRSNQSTARLPPYTSRSRKTTTRYSKSNTHKSTYGMLRTTSRN